MKQKRKITTLLLEREVLEVLKLCHQVLKDHVQYEEGEVSLEGEAFRLSDVLLKSLGEVPCGSSQDS